MVCFDERDLDSPGVRYGGRRVHGKRVNPFRVDAQHVDDQVRRGLRTIDRANLPLGRKVRVVVGMRMAGGDMVRIREMNKSAHVERT